MGAGRSLPLLGATVVGAVTLFALASRARPPDDATTLRRLVTDTVAAYARGDSQTVWRAHDLDFRQMCDRAQVAAAVAAVARPVGVVAIEPPRVRAARAAAAVRWRDRDGEHVERWQFVNDAGHWYLLGDALTCRPPGL